MGIIYERDAKWIGAWMLGNEFNNTDMGTGNAQLRTA